MSPTEERKESPPTWAEVALRGQKHGLGEKDTNRVATIENKVENTRAPGHDEGV
jgi:hypothetical protein